MQTYYAIMDGHGPISRAIEADTIEEARSQFVDADKTAWYDEPVQDLDDDMDIDTDGWSEEYVRVWMESHGFRLACSLTDPLWIDGGWRLYEQA